MDSHDFVQDRGIFVKGEKDGTAFFLEPFREPGVDLKEVKIRGGEGKERNVRRICMKVPECGRFKEAVELPSRSRTEGVPRVGRVDVGVTPVVSLGEILGRILQVIIKHCELHDRFSIIKARNLFQVQLEVF